MALFVALRWAARRMSHRFPSTVDLIAMFLMFSATQGALGVLLVRLFPGAGA